MPHRAARCIVVLGACLPGIASAATIVVDPSGITGVSSLEAALAIAKDGDTLKLVPGEYPPVVLNNRQLTITGTAPGARIGSLEVQGGALTISEIEFVGPGIGLAVHDAVLTAQNLLFDGNNVRRGDPAILVSGTAVAEFSQVEVQQWRAEAGVVVLQGGANAKFTESIFAKNHSADGGAIRVDGGALVVRDSTFDDNTAEAWGGDIAASGGSVSVYDSIFSGSAATYGGSIGVGGQTALQVVDTAFYGPSAVTSGGFLYVEDATATLIRVAGVDAASETGGAIALFRSQLVAEDLTLARNRADLGGHLHGAESTALLTRTHLTAGTANQGAAIAWGSGTLVVENALWVSQEGTSNGGALYVAGGEVSLSQATFADNQAVFGSAIAMDGGRVELGSSILYGNLGDALVVAGTGQLIITTSIVYGTVGTDFTGNVQIANSVSAVDPRFSAPSAGDYSLRATSPALDALAGDGDLDGTAIDLGAFGGPGSWTLPDADEDGYVLGRDCNDYDAEVNESVADAWYDGVDANCDERDDYDQDGDGFRAFAYGGTDCDDTDDTVHPAAVEISGDDLDGDCDGLLDVDNDGDGWTASLDCDDDDPDIHPMANDEWYDGIDSDCRGNDDFDADGDGTSTLQGDCNDNDDRIGPDAVEVADDGVDQDCDGKDLETTDTDSFDSDSEVATAGTDTVAPEPERILTKTGCSTVPGSGSVPASFLAACGFLLFYRRRT
jgi:hypothetical protein